MKTIVFLTGEDMLDVDMPVVKEIHKSYDFTWVIILKGYGWFSESFIEEFCNSNNIKFILLIQNFKLKNPKTPFFHLKVLRLLRSLNPDLIYDSYLGVPFMHIFSSLFVPQHKFVIAIHDVIQHYKIKNRAIRSFYYNFLMKKYEKIHLFSEGQYKEFTKIYPQKKVLLAPLCLKDFGKSTLMGTATKNAGECHFLIFGIIRKNKGVDLLIEAVKLLSLKYPKIIVTIAGKSEGNCWNECEKLIEDKSLFDLKIRMIENDEVPDLLCKANFMVLPYRDVTQSGVLLGSYNYGLPVIASDLEGFNEYVKDGSNGFLFKCGDVQSLAEKMEQAICLNTTQYSEMKQALNKYAEEEISVSAISKKYIKYFNENLN